MDDTAQSVTEEPVLEPGPRKLSLSDRCDMVLVLQDESELNASSHLLKHASSIFATLLEQQPSEELQQDPQQPRKVPLPDDDPVAMFNLCSVLHHKLPPITPDAGDEQMISRILDLAILADKYDAIKSIEMPAGSLLSRFMRFGATSELSMTSLSDLVLAAWVFQLPSQFSVFSSRLVRDHMELYSALLKQRITTHLGAAAILYLKEQRTAAKKLCSALIGDLSSIQCCAPTPEQSGFHVFPVFKMPTTDDFFSSAQHYSLNAMVGRLASCNIMSFSLTCQHLPFRSGIEERRLRELISQVYDSSPGLCLECATKSPDECDHVATMLKHIRENGGA